MNGIRAFVGHSFTADDDAVTTTFLKYFSSLSKSSLNFSWTHAEPAEPKALAEKVIALLSDCNLFIAICTRKERVVAPSALSGTIFPRGYLKAGSRDFTWKTSDWIIQEIGLAIGKELGLILLLESGVQTPGGLQGDIEYISFDRDYPARSFQKVFEMISAISPKISGATTSASSDNTRSPPTEGKSEEPALTDENWWMPQPGWSRRRYEIVLMHMVDTGDEEKARTIYEAYLNTEQAAQGDNRQSWEALAEYTRFRFGKGGSLAKLKALAEAHSKSAGTLEQLAKGFAQYDDHLASAKTYEAAGAATQDEAQGLRLMGQAAVEYARGRESVTASEIIGRIKPKVGTIAGGELLLLRVLGEIAEIAKDVEATIAIMERAIEVQPDDDRTRFLLAYKHSEKGNKDLALFHYLKIREQRRDASTWNNLGVAFEQAGLPAKAVSAYRESEQLGETLAMSNLAQKFMSAGFLSEAQQECEKGLKVDDFHQNIASTLAELKSVPEEEDKKQAESLEKAKPVSDFYKQFGRAMLRRDPTEIAARWKGPECEVSAQLVGGEFEAIGSYQQSTSGLGLALAGTFGLRAQSPPDRYHVKYKGAFQGQAIEGFVSRTLEDDPTKVRGLLSSMEYSTKVLMVLTDDGNEILMMDNPEKRAAAILHSDKSG